jgi:hypothetical protein
LFGIEPSLGDGGRAEIPTFQQFPRGFVEPFPETLEEGARKRPLGIRDLLCFDLCTGEAKTAVSGLHITLTREDAVATVPIPWAQMTFTPELVASPADDQSDADRGLSFRFRELRQNWPDGAPA